MNKKFFTLFILFLFSIISIQSFAQRYEYIWNAPITDSGTDPIPDASSGWLDADNWLYWDGSNYVQANTQAPPFNIPRYYTDSSDPTKTTHPDVLIPTFQLNVVATGSGALVFTTTPTNTCTIDDAPDPNTDYHDGGGNISCQSLTIQAHAAVDNNLLSSNNLSIKRDLIIEDNGYFFTNATLIEINRDLWIKEGADNATSPGGSFIVRQQDCQIDIGRHYFNEGMMAKQNISSAVKITLTLSGTEDALLYAKAGEHRTSNKMKSEALGLTSNRATFRFGYLLTTTDDEIFKTGAFDKIFIQKDATAGATVQNSAKPPMLATVTHVDDATADVGVVNTATVRYSIMSGIVGDGITNLGGTTYGYNVTLPGSEDPFLDITGGSVIVNNVTALAGDENFSGETVVSGSQPVQAVNDRKFRVYDDTDEHPSSAVTWSIPQADINVRGNVFLRTGGSVDQTGLNLYKGDASGTELCLHIGGSLNDGNNLDPTTNTGFYVGPFVAFDGTRQNRPYVIFNGENTSTQNIQGSLNNLHDYNGVPNLGQGIALPNVYIKRPAGGVVRHESSSNVQILGDLTIFSGEYDTNGTLLEMGDHGGDEINILAVDNSNATGTPDNQPDVHGVLRVTAGTTVLVGNVRNNCDTRQYGAYIRVRKGGYMYLQGTSSNWVAIREHGVECAQCRMTTYAGGVFYAQYASFFRPQQSNQDIDIDGKFSRDATLAANYTDTATDGTHFSAYGRDENGGYSLFPESYLMKIDATNHSFSNCSIFEAGSTTLLSIDTYNEIPFDNDPNDGSNDYDLSDGALKNKNFRITGTNFQGGLKRNYSVVSLLDPANGTVTIVDSKGELGGLHGEDNDKRIGNHKDARILWENQPRAVWTGEFSNEWDDSRNWEITATVTLTGTASTTTTENPQGIIPGVNAEDLDVVIPCESNSSWGCRAGTVNSTYNINGGIYVRETDGALQPSVYSSSCDKEKWFVVQENATPVTFNIKGDIFVRKGGVFSANNAEFHVEGGILLRDGRRARDNQFGSRKNVSTLLSGTSTFYMEGAQTAIIYPRHNQFYNLVINKANEGATVVARLITPSNTQESRSGGSRKYTWMVNGSLTISRGTLLVRNGRQVSIQGDYVQTGGTFNPIESDVVVRGDFLASSGTYVGSGNELRLYPLPTGPQSKTIIANANTLVNDIVIGDGDDIRLTNRKRYLKPNGKSFTQTGAGSTGRLPSTHTANPAQRQSRQAGFVFFGDGPDRYIQVSGVTDSTGTSRKDEAGVLNGGTSPTGVLDAEGVYHDNVTDPTFTYVLQSDLISTGKITIKGNRTLNANGYGITAGSGSGDAIDVLSRGRLEIESNETAQGFLRIKPGSALTVRANGELKFVGLPSRYVVMTQSDATGTGKYEVRLGGLIEARYYIFEHLWERGIYMNSSSKSISNGIVSYGGGGQEYTSPIVEPRSFFEGFGVAADANVTENPVEEIIVTNSGSGYTAVPNVDLTTGGVGSGGATATANLVGSPVSDYNITDGGSGYTSTPTVTIAAPSTLVPNQVQAVALAVMAPSEVTDIDSPLATGGAGYTLVPTVEFTGGGVADANDQADGQVILSAAPLVLQNLPIENGGNGYIDATYTETAANTYVEINTPTTAGDLPLFEVTVSGGTVTDVKIIQIDDTGTADPPAEYELPISVDVLLPTTGDATTFVIENIEVSATEVKEIIVTTGGSGYTSKPTVTFSGGGSPSTTAVVDPTSEITISAGGGSVVGLDFDCATCTRGDGYLVNPSITIDAPSSGVTATAVGVTEGGKVTSITIGAGGLYRQVPDVVIDAPPSGVTTTAYATGKGGEISGFNITNNGESYRTAPRITIFDSGGGIGFGASARAKLVPAGVDAINVLYGGPGTGAPADYVTPMTIEVTSANGDGLASETLTSPTDFTVTVIGGVIDDITLTATGKAKIDDAIGAYTTAPNLKITSAGEGANIKALLETEPIVTGLPLEKGQIASVVLDPYEAFPAAAFSDGIISSLSYDVAGGSSAFTFDENYQTFRDGTAPVGDYDKLNSTATLNADYGITFDYSTNPAVDTIYNVIFAENPSIVAGGANFDDQKNVVRSSSTGTFPAAPADSDYQIVENPRTKLTDAENARFIVFRNAVGPFQGEKFDAGFTGRNGSNNGTDAGPSEDYVEWLERDVKRWDGGATFTDRSWADDANWFPNGVPTADDDILIDYSRVNVDYTTNLKRSPSDPDYGLPIITAPNEIVIDMDHSYTGLATGQNLTFDTRIESAVKGGPSLDNRPITINIQNVSAGVDFQLGGTISVPEHVTINVINNGGNPVNINIGESYINDGTFNDGDGVSTVNFYRNSSRVVSNTLDVSTDKNGLNNVTFSAGQTTLLTDIWAKGDILFDGGSFDFGTNHTVFLDGDWTQEAAANVNQSGTVHFRGTNAQEVTHNISGTASQNVGQFGSIAIDKSMGSVELNNRIRANGQISFINGLFESADDKEFILGPNYSYADNPDANSFVNGPVGHLFASTSTGTAKSYPVGGIAGTDNRYVGDTDGSVDLDIALSSTDTTLVVVTQHEAAYSSLGYTKTLPSTEPYNMVSNDRYWTVQVKDYNRLNDNALSSATIENGRITLSLLPNFETVNASALNPDIIKEVTIIKDAIKAFDATAANYAQYQAAPNNQAAYAPEDASTHTANQQRGTAYPSEDWRVIPVEASVTNDEDDFTSNSRVEFTSVLTTGNFGNTGATGNLGAGVFAFAFNNIVLPLEILDFQAKKINSDEVLLEWTTVNEEFSKFFVVERSKDGVNFEDIHQEVALGLLSSDINNYEFIDENPHNGINYYRIRQVEFDENIEYTVIRSVNIDQSSQFVVYPNPSYRGDMLRILAPVEFGETVNIRLMDITGIEISNREIEANSNVFDFEVSRSLIPGVYILEVTTEDSTFTEKLLIK